MTDPSARKRSHWSKGPHRGARLFLAWLLLFAAFQLLDALRQVVGWGSGDEPTAQVELGARATALAGSALESLAGGDAVRGPYSVQVVLANSSLWQRLGLQAGQLITYALVIAVGAVVWRMVAGAGEGELFTRTNVRRLELVAALIGAGGMAEQFLAGAAQFWATVHSPLRDDIAWSVELTVMPVLVAAVVLVVAQIWSRAVRLREDAEGLV